MMLSAYPRQVNISVFVSKWRDATHLYGSGVDQAKADVVVTVEGEVVKDRIGLFAGKSPTEVKEWLKAR